MLVKNLRIKSKTELLNLVDNLKAELFMLRFQNKTGQLDKPHKIVQIRKDIAKVFTILNARKLSIEKQIIVKSSKVKKQEEKVEIKQKAQQITNKSTKPKSKPLATIKKVKKQEVKAKPNTAPSAKKTNEPKPKVSSLAKKVKESK